MSGGIGGHGAGVGGGLRNIRDEEGWITPHCYTKKGNKNQSPMARLQFKTSNKYTTERKKKHTVVRSNGLVCLLSYETAKENTGNHY